MEYRNEKKLIREGLLKRKTLFLMIFFVLFWFPSGISAQIPPAGETVSSQSYATYSFEGSSCSAFSNEILLEILPIFNLLVLPDGTVSSPAVIDSAFSGEKALFEYTITNSGNTPGEYTLNIIQLPPSDFSFRAAELYMDDNKNGAVDPGEDAINSSVLLDPSESLAVILEAELPAGARGGETAHLNLEVLSQSDTSVTDSDNVVRVAAREEARISLLMSSDRTTVMPEDSVTFTVDYSNEGDREARDVTITEFIDYRGNIENTEFIEGSVVSTLPGEIEFYDVTYPDWIKSQPQASDIKGIRLKLDYLPPDAAGSFSFMVRVNEDHESGQIENSSFAEYTAGDSADYNVYSDKISVFVGRKSSISIGPLRPEMMENENDENVITMNVDGSTASYTFWHEVLSEGNFVDTVAVSISDSVLIPDRWSVEFVDSGGTVITEGSGYTAIIGALGIEESATVGIRYNAAPEAFRSFTGSTLGLEVRANSLVDVDSQDMVTDLFVKTDLPLVSVEQSIKEPVASIGDVLSCILTVNNLTEDTSVDSLTVVETLCPGLGFAGGSIEPTINGNKLSWDIESLEAGEKKEIVFRVRVKAGQQRGRLVSRAKVYGVSEYGEKTAAGPASASIRIVEGIFTRKGIITGSVFFDSDSSGRRGENEDGIFGVSVFLENGTYSITDSSGAYSIPGVIEGTHVLRVDPESLPDTLISSETGHFGMGVGGEAIVDLPPSGNRRVDFPLVLKMNEQREHPPSNRGEKDVKEYGKRRTSAVKNSAGTYGPAVNAEIEGKEKNYIKAADNRRIDVELAAPEDSQVEESQPDTMLKGTKGEERFISGTEVCSEIVEPEEGALFRQRDRVEVVVSSPLGSVVNLYVNNIPVGREKIGKKKIDIGRKTIVQAFYGVKIEPGENELLVVSKEYGGKKNTCVRHVYLAGNPARIIPEKAEVSIPADGKSSEELVFLVKDRNGLSVRDGIFVDVEGPGALIEGIDANPQRNGVQVATAGGKAVINIPPSIETEKTRISVRYDDIRAGSLISYESLIRDWFLFGYGETDIGINNITGSGAWDRSGRSWHKGLFAEGKIAFYGQGEIAQGHLMTVAVDTRPAGYDKLLDRIEPEKFYPIYGDASRLRFNSSSRRGTYLKMEHKKYSAMFGDFRTELGGMQFNRYERTFTGFKGKAEFKGGSINAFVTRTDQATFQEEIPADGTSGFYFLENYPLIENSEKIRIEVRDRYQPEKIVKVDYKAVNRDYDINYNDGTILFKEPLPTVDENLNPVVIIVSYESADSKDSNFIYGARYSISVTDSLKAGVTAVLEEEGDENSSLFGVDLKGKILPGVRVEGEFGHSEKFLLGAGDAFRVKFEGRKKNFPLWNVYYRRIDKTFFNPSFSGGKNELGSEKFGAGLDWKLNTKFSLKSKGYTHSFMERDEKKKYLDVAGVYRKGSLRGEAGLAGITHSSITDPPHSAVMLTTSVSAERKGFEGEVTYDQKLSGMEVEEYPNRLEGRLSRTIWKDISAELIHEYRTGSRSGTRHRTRFGVESKINRNLNVYSRYSLEGAMSGKRGQATIGLNNRFSFSNDLSGTIAAERLSTVSGVEKNDFTSLSVSGNYTPDKKDYRLKGDYEIRFDSDRTKHLFSAGGIKRMDDRWSGLTKGDIWFSDEDNKSDRVKASSTFGLSLRPESADALVLLAFLKTRYEKNSPAHPGGVDKELLFSTEAVYDLNPEWKLEGKVAAKWVRNTFRKYSASASTFMYQTQVIKLLPGEWDVTLTGRIVSQRETGTVRFSAGIEAGKIVAKNIWLGAGYDFSGHQDDGVEENDFLQNGFHVGMKMKFNEKLMNYFYR